MTSIGAWGIGTVSSPALRPTIDDHFLFRDGTFALDEFLELLHGLRRRDHSLLVTGYTDFAVPMGDGNAKPFANPADMLVARSKQR